MNGSRENLLLQPSVRDSIVVSISACHADDPGSIPGRGVFSLWKKLKTTDSKNFKPKNKNLKYLITDTNGKILKNSFDLNILLKSTNWKKL